MNIGMALSGGGYRATVFHLGVLEWFARTGRFDDVRFFSTVSGGSICVGLIYATAENKWPTSSQYSQTIVPKIKDLLTTVDLQKKITTRGIFNPFSTRADDLAKLMEKEFKMKGTLQDIPEDPRLIINATTYETGKLFRFEQRRMADYRLGGVKKPTIKLSEAVAASAGFPVGIGPLILDPDDYNWFAFRNKVLTDPIPPPNYKKLHLWDGGVYDNLADEPLFDPGDGWRDGVDFLVVSDASGLFDDDKAYSFGAQPLKRLLDIATSQVRAVRARSLVDYMEDHPGSGIYLQIDNPAKAIMQFALKHGPVQEPAPAGALDRVLDADDVEKAARMPTHIHDLKEAEFDLLFRQGFEVANATYYGFVNAESWLDFS